MTGRLRSTASALIVTLALLVGVGAAATVTSGCTTKDNGGVITPSPTTTTTR